MTINLSIPNTEPALKPRITVIGIGGAGGNAVNNMISSQLEGVEFVVTNTDSQALVRALSDRRIQLGVGVTQGLGAGARPEIGRAAAEESFDEITDHMQGSNMVFMAAGMGGGTGTGAAPVIARAARELGILTVGVVTKPFHFEGQNRMRVAEEGIRELQQIVDTLIIIPNQNLFRIANQHTTFADAFKMADNVLMSGVRGVTDLMVMPGLINLDFADVRSVMSEMGKAMMGTGEAEGEKRAIDAAEAAISNPLLDDVSMKGARGVLINITGGMDLTLFEVDEAANRIREEVDSDANIIFGSTFDETMEGVMRVSVIATGIDAADSVRTAPTRLSVVGGALPTKPAVETPAPAVETPPAAASTPPSDAPVHSTPAASTLSAPAVAEDHASPFASWTEENGTPQQPADTAAEIPTILPDEPQAASADHGHSEESAIDAPFIPPRPLEVKPLSQPTGSPDPFAAAALVNGGRDTASTRKPATRSAPTRGRGMSLFERVTGTGRARTKPEEPGAGRPETPAHTPAATTEKPQKSGIQSGLGGLDPADRHSPSTSGDELLDIPAFLRRQAN